MYISSILDVCKLVLLYYWPQLFLNFALNYFEIGSGRFSQGVNHGEPFISQPASIFQAAIPNYFGKGSKFKRFQASDSNDDHKLRPIG